MVLDASTRRRWFGALVLALALVMLLCGETVLKDKLGNVAFIFYWLLCIGFTSLAILVAFLDARALRHQTRQQQRELFEATLKEIERETRKRPHQPGRRR